MGSQCLLNYLLNKKNILSFFQRTMKKPLPKLLVKIQEFAASTENEVLLFATTVVVTIHPRQ